MQNSNEYMRVYMADRRARRRAEIERLLGGKCIDCEETQNLDVNHIDPSTRSFRLSGRGLDKPWEVILEEIKKCDLRCKAHHVEVTRQQWADGLIQLNPHNRHRPAAPFVHGTSRTYVEKTCRCMCCRAARSLHRKKMLPFNELAHTTPPKGCLCNTKFQKRLVSKNFRKHHRHT